MCYQGRWQSLLRPVRPDARRLINLQPTPSSLPLEHVACVRPTPASSWLSEGGYAPPLLRALPCKSCDNTALRPPHYQLLSLCVDSQCLISLTLGHIPTATLDQCDTVFTIVGSKKLDAPRLVDRIGTNKLAAGRRCFEDDVKTIVPSNLNWIFVRRNA